MVLAGVLGLAAEDIQVREAACPAPPVTANAAPSPRPNNPHPNASWRRPVTACEAFLFGDS